MRVAGCGLRSVVAAFSQVGVQRVGASAFQQQHDVADQQHDVDREASKPPMGGAPGSFT